MNARNALLFFVVACSSSAPKAPAESPPERPAESSTSPSTDARIPAPTGAVAQTPAPFSPAELRASLPVGTVLRFRVTEADQPTTVQVWEFVQADDTGCTIASTVLDEGGGIVVPRSEGTSSWEELSAHAVFPAEQTTRTDSQVAVAAGNYAAWVYRVESTVPEGSVSTFRFAKELPGPPVLMEVHEGHNLVRRMELLSRELGPKSASTTTKATTQCRVDSDCTIVVSHTCADVRSCQISCPGSGKPRAVSKASGIRSVAPKDCGSQPPCTPRCPEVHDVSRAVCKAGTCQLTMESLRPSP